MKVAYLLIALSGTAFAQGSDIPPRVDVVTECGKVTLVSFTDAGKIQSFKAADTPQPLLEQLAARAPWQQWIDAGCKR